MIVNTRIDEVKKRENSFEIIKQLLKNKNRVKLYDLTGLSGGFPLKDDDIDLLENYIGSAIFEELLQKEAKKHLDGEKALAVNRTSSGILATILSLVPKDTYVVHFLAKSPAHPSIPLSTEIVNAKYLEFDKIDEFEIPDNTSLVVITGSTMDHQVISTDNFKKVINDAKIRNIPTLVDDASGARLRTAIFKQPTAIEMGADLVITSTDKLLSGPRGGLMAGRSDLIDKIKTKSYQLGVEAQSPQIAGIVRALEEYNPENLVDSITKKDDLYKGLKEVIPLLEKTPTGVMLTVDALKKEVVNRNIVTELSENDLSFVWAMILLKNYGIITIPAVGMPKASATIRFDMAAQDAKNYPINELTKTITNSFEDLLDVIDDTDKCREIIFN